MTLGGNFGLVDSARDFQQNLAAGAAYEPFQTTTVIDHAAEISVPPEIALDAETMFAYLRTHMKNLDEQIRGELTDMDHRRARLTDATTALTDLRALQSEARTTHVDNDDQTSDDGIDLSGDGAQPFLDAMVKAGVSPDDARKIIDGWRNGKDRATADDIQAAIDAVNDRVGALNSDNEYQMLHINELMSQRSQLVQMVSKMMSNMDETARAVIGNMR